MFRNTYFRLGIISTIAALCLLIVLPRIEVKVDNHLLKLNSFIGGYEFRIGSRDFNLTEFKTGLDLNGGVRVVLEANLDDIDATNHDFAIESAVKVIERRLELFGVSESYVTTQKTGELRNIIVEIPGVGNVSEVIDLIGESAKIRFKVLKEEVEWDSGKYQNYYFDTKVWEELDITGSDLDGADVIFGASDPANPTNVPYIQLRFTDDGREKFFAAAKKNVGRPIAIYLDEDAVPVSMAEVDPQLANDTAGDPVIGGSFDVQQARALSLQIRAGAMPVSVEVVEQKTIGATLGEESVTKSMFAGIVGLGLVLLFMVYMYGGFGILASFSLIVYSTIVLAVFKVVPIVLTLPGIAGFILSIGIASDANILVFERVKEEMLWGKPKNIAVSEGFARAWLSIRDSNIASLVAASVLLYFGAGPVKSFATSLIIGIVVSMFTSSFIVKTLIEVFNVGNNRKTK